MFGPEYPKIQTAFKRDDRGVIIPGEWSLPEFEYLANKPWRWSEKIDGTNIRLHWNGVDASIGGRTDNAQVPKPLTQNLQPQFEPALWKSIFEDADDVTVYGEGYGAKIQSGGMYRPDQSLIVFDVKVGRWWLKDEDVADVAKQLGLEVVPHIAEWTLEEAWSATRNAGYQSAWPDARVEGLVGRPAVELFNRKGERLMVKLKVKDWTDYQRRNAS